MVNDDERVIIISHACIDVCESGDTHMDYRDTLCVPRHSIISVDVLDISEEEIENLVNEDILHTPESIEGRVKGMFG